MRALMLLRHAKSDWSENSIDDFARPLAKRGQSAAKKMGAWMKRHNIIPEHLVCSSAARARETVKILCDEFEMPLTRVSYEDRLYLADVDSLLNVLRDCPQQAKSIMLIGHNPGLEDLLIFLCGEDVPTSANGKLLPTASLAQISLPDKWESLKKRSGQLIDVTRPKEL